MAAGVSVGDEGQGREGGNLDSSQKSNDGKRVMVPACSVTTMHIACHGRTYTSLRSNEHAQSLSVNKKSLLTLDRHGLCEIGRNKPLRLRLARPCWTNELGRTGGRP
jgi:hypothetical protein